MQISGVPADAFEALVSQVSTRDYAGNVIIKGGVSVQNRARDRFRVALRVVDSSGEGARRAASDRRTVSACWHVFRDVFAELFRNYPRATVRTMFANYYGVHGFVALYPATAWRNVGSAFYPRQASELCDCDRAPVDLDLDAVLAETEMISRERHRRIMLARSNGLLTDDEVRAEMMPAVRVTRPAPVTVVTPDDDKSLSPVEWLEREYARKASPEHGVDYITRAIEQYAANPDSATYQADNSATWTAPSDSRANYHGQAPGDTQDHGGTCWRPGFIGCDDSCPQHSDARGADECLLCAANLAD